MYSGPSIISTAARFMENLKTWNETYVQLRQTTYFGPPNGLDLKHRALSLYLSDTYSTRRRDCRKQNTRLTTPEAERASPVKVHVNDRSNWSIDEVFRRSGWGCRRVTCDELRTECEHVSTSIFLGIHEQSLLLCPGTARACSWWTACPILSFQITVFFS
jgi:hypothetical protein